METKYEQHSKIASQWFSFLSASWSVVDKRDGLSKKCNISSLRYLGVDSQAEQLSFLMVLRPVYDKNMWGFQFGLISRQAPTDIHIIPLTSARWQHHFNKKVYIFERIYIFSSQLNWYLQEAINHSKIIGSVEINQDIDYRLQIIDCR